MHTYLVWHRFESQHDGKKVQAKSSFEARKVYVKEKVHTEPWLTLTDCMATRVRQ